MDRNTQQALAEVTDEGRFERLATAILREFHPLCAELTHPGVNAAGKTRRAPLDGIGFVPNSTPPHMVAVHHTTTDIRSLAGKWLHDPATVRPRRNGKPSAPAGDLLKTAEIVAAERLRSPGLLATLVLTTNAEPGEDLVRNVKAAGRARGIEIDIWSRSRLAHHLDKPAGQWIRHDHLGSVQARLSRDLMVDLSRRSLEAYPVLDDPQAWVERLDEGGLRNLRRPLTFVTAESGLGKSVACRRAMAAHIDAGGFALVLSDEQIARCLNLDAAVSEAARALHPTLAAGENPISLASSEAPLLLVVEDVNAAGDSQRLITKLIQWCTRSETQGARPFRVLCPLWPQALAGLNDQMRRLADAMLCPLGPMTRDEGRAAVRRRAEVSGRPLSDLEAAGVADALGQDPLLIGLYDGGPLDPHRVIGNFIAKAVGRAAATSGAPLAGELAAGLSDLSRRMLLERRVTISWPDIESWFADQPGVLASLRSLIKQGELIRGAGPSQLMFRHDRVRDALLIEAGTALVAEAALPDATLADPFFAEILGGILARRLEDTILMDQVSRHNPLALFEALRLSGASDPGHRHGLLRAIETWLAMHQPAPDIAHLRWSAVRKLGQTDAPEVPGLAAQFTDFAIDRGLAQLRNGDLNGGVLVCINLQPGTGATWRDLQVAHARLRHGPRLVVQMDAALRLAQAADVRLGLLRLAGHFAEPALADAIAACWDIDEGRNERLGDYLWAAAQCCGGHAARLLGPICEAWANLSDVPRKEHAGSPRDELASDHIRWAFARWPPVAALEFFMRRADHADLDWPITVMLDSVDDPGVLAFIADRGAAIWRRLEGGSGFSPWFSHLSDQWRRQQEESGLPMSTRSRERLQSIWQDVAADRHTRRAALQLWGATVLPGDLAVLGGSAGVAGLEDQVLRLRLARGDLTAVPDLIERLRESPHGFYWWYNARDLWTPALTSALEADLCRRRAEIEPDATIRNGDHKMAEMIMRQPVDEAERLLLEHWDHVRGSSLYVSAALYVATPALAEKVAEAVDDAPDPAELFMHLSQHYGVGLTGHPGVTRPEQLEGLAPYIPLLDPLDISCLAEACNDLGWYDLRRRLFDPAMASQYRERWRAEDCDAEFDQLVTHRHAGWVDLSITRILATGVSWAELWSIILKWYGARRSLDALRLTTAAVEAMGTRADLAMIPLFPELDAQRAEPMLKNSAFVVQRRSAN